MKIRLGFVSNSSSASYYVKIQGISLEDFLGTLLGEYSWKYFSKRDLDERLEERINLEEEYLAENTKLKKKTPLPEFFTTQRKNHLEELKTKRQVLNNLNENTIDLIKFGLEDYNITYSEGEDGVTLTDWTSMHNDYNDMNNLLKEITLYFLFETTHKIIAKMEHDY